MGDEYGETVLAAWPDDTGAVKGSIRSIELLWRDDVSFGPSGALLRFEGGLRIAIEEWGDNLYAGHDFRFVGGERRILLDFKGGGR